MNKLLKTTVAGYLVQVIECMRETSHLIMSQRSVCGPLSGSSIKTLSTVEHFLSTGT